jgi:hypothetical protein
MDLERVHPAIRQPPPSPRPPLIAFWRSTITYCFSRAGRGDPSQGRAGEPGGGGPGVVGIGVQPDDQRVVRGAAARDGPGRK